MDTKRWEDWGLVFTTAAVMEVPEADMVVNGRDEIVAAVSGALEGVRTVHHGHMPEIQITGSDTGSGTWAMFDYVEWPEQEGARVGLQGYGHYHETYAREEGQWRIASTRLERLRVDPLGRPPQPATFRTTPSGRRRRPWRRGAPRRPGGGHRGSTSTARRPRGRPAGSAPRVRR